MYVAGMRHVVQVDIANLGFGIPLEHGVDGFGKLCTAGLVDAASIDPYPVITVVKRNIASLFDFDRDEGIAERRVLRDEQLDVAEGLLGALPDMREDSVAARNDVWAVEVDELETVG